MNHLPANQQTLVKLLAVAVMMFGFGYAMVPFYRALCDALELNSVIKADRPVTNTQVDTGRSLTIEFDTNLRSNLPWTFTAVEKSVRVHPGALTQVTFEVRNQSNRPVTGQAIPSFGPQVALLQEARLLLLHPADAGTGRSPADAGCFRGRAGIAAGREYRNAVLYVLRS